MGKDLSTEILEGQQALRKQLATIKPARGNGDRWKAVIAIATVLVGGGAGTKWVQNEHRLTAMEQQLEELTRRRNAWETRVRPLDESQTERRRTSFPGRPPGRRTPPT